MVCISELLGGGFRFDACGVRPVLYHVTFTHKQLTQIEYADVTRPRTTTMAFRSDQALAYSSPHTHSKLLGKPQRNSTLTSERCGKTGADQLPGSRNTFLEMASSRPNSEVGWLTQGKVCSFLRQLKDRRSLPPTSVDGRSHETLQCECEIQCLCRRSGIRHTWSTITAKCANRHPWPLSTRSANKQQ
jgi:hypothetical protein